MARRFRGESEQTVDSKGRVSVPAPFRRVIEACDPNWQDGLRPELVIVYGGETQKFLECYTIEAIEQIDRRIDLMKKGSFERRMMERIYHGFATPAQIVEDGRIVLPLKLRKKLALEDKAFFIASGDHFQVWKPSTYEEIEMSKVDAWLSEQDENFDPSSLLPDLPEG